MNYNICRVITWLPVGGIERRLVSILPRLNRERFNVRLVCLREKGALAGELEAAGVPVDVIPFHSRLSPGGLRALSRYFNAHKIDLVHAHMYRSYIPSSIAARWAGVPVMLGQVHNVDTWDSTRQRMMDRLLWKLRDGMLAVSERVKDDVCKTLGCPPEFVHVLYNGVDLSTFRDIKMDLSLKQELGLQPQDTIAVVVARLHPQKNHQMLFRALQKLKERSDSLKIVLVGDGAAREQLEAQANEMSLNRTVIFAGRRDDVAKFYKIADFSILPSLKEGFSNTVIESMAAGCPIIATDVGGNREAIMDGECGLIVPSDNEDAMARAIQRLLNDAELRKKLAHAGRQRADIFSLEAMIEQTESLYLDFLTRKKAGANE